MKPCAKCKREYPESDYGTWHGEENRTCEPCLRRVREIYSLKREAYRRSMMAETVPWDAIKKAYSLTTDEAHAVDLAAGQVIIGRRWRARNPRQRWPGQTAEAVVDALTDSVARRCQLLGAVSLRLRERLVLDGIEPAAFFNTRGLPR